MAKNPNWKKRRSYKGEFFHCDLCDCECRSEELRERKRLGVVPNTIDLLEELRQVQCPICRSWQVQGTWWDEAWNEELAKAETQTERVES